jgi:CheY-like chemotaxis protein
VVDLTEGAKLTETRRPKVLCVDDEPGVLEGLSLNLRRKYETLTATSGPVALEILRTNECPAVIVSDMRMPEMDGATFLAQARELAPDATRILLTGQADIESAIAAVNEGQIFRFLTKPCPPARVLAAVQAAAGQHRLVTAERVLLEQTLSGSIRALMDVLSLTNPLAFGRSQRLKELANELAEVLKIEARWQLDVAAMLSQLGTITLPPETVERIYYGVPLSDSELKMVGRLPTVTEALLTNIPRLEGVREILRGLAQPAASVTGDPSMHFTNLSVEVLRVARDYFVLEAQGNSVAETIAILRGRHARYDLRVVDALAQARNAPTTNRGDVRELPLESLRSGMIFAEDVKMTNGMLLVARGNEVTDAFVQRVRNFEPGAVRLPIRVVVRPSATTSVGPFASAWKEPS